MKNSTKTRIAAAALASALGLGVFTWGLRASTGVQRLLARLRGPVGTGTTGTAAAADTTGLARNAFLVGTSPAGAAGATLASLKSGAFTGKRQYAYYGYIKVQAIVQSGSLTDIKVLEYPSDNGRSQYINQIALPYLIQEAVDAQSWRVDLISGATFTSEAFVLSLQAALKQAGA